MTVTGFGYWTGLDISVEFRPANENTGIRFVRTDLDRQPQVLAHIWNRTQAPRRTTICRDGVAVEMIEHIMAALAGLKIDNCQIRVDGSEMPGCDGSALAFVEALSAAGLQPQSAIRSRLVVNETIRIGDDENCWIQIEPANEFRISYHLDYPNHRQIGKQYFEISVTPESFVAEIAAARTFLLKHEADWLRQKGLGHRVSYKDLLVFAENGPINNRLRYDNECVRHKVLDVIGDFSLSAYDILGHVTASRSGHRLNSELVRRILSHGRIEGAPNFESLVCKTT